MIRNSLLLALFAGLPLSAAAEWTPSAELGIVNTTGNSETTSANGKFALHGEDDLWTHDYHVAALRAEQDDEVSANRFEVGAKAARKLTERTYLGGVARYENDEFSAYEYQATLALNYGFKAIDNETTKLLLEAGPGVRRAELADTGETESGALLRGFADFNHQFTPTTTFFNTFLVEASSDNTFAQNDIGIAVAINHSLALKVAFQVRHNTDVPVNVESTDTQTTVNIVWSPGKSDK